MNIVEENWKQILEKMKNEYCQSNIAYNTWISPLTVYEVKDNTVFILVELKASLEHIEEKYLLPFKVCIAEVTGIEYDVEFVTESEDTIQEKKEKAHKKNKANALYEKANLNPKYTFDTFVVGKNNNFAYAASHAVSKSPGEIYNPLFIYGGVGLGKTHLMHSIAHYILENDPSKKVLYVTSETFTNELIDCLKAGKSDNVLAMTKFREKYRSIDVLLIDDIQFIIGKDSTQEEFFHTFNHLYGSDKAIIISSDKPPKEIKPLETRLTSRFEMGLTCDISAPDYETRMAILRKKEELDGLEKYHIPDEVMQYIANNIKSNIRELEGSLNKLIALSNLEKRSIDISLAAEALKDIITSDNTRKVTPELILEVVADHFGLSVDDVRGAKKTANVVLPRQIIMYLCNQLTDSTHKAIAIVLRRKDHSTIIHGINKIENSIKTNETLSNTIDIIKKKINPI